jgi:hypothetical protein
MTIKTALNDTGSGCNQVKFTCIRTTPWLDSRASVFTDSVFAVYRDQKGMKN